MLDRGWGLVQRKSPDSEPTQTQSTAQPQQAAGYSWRPIAIGEPSSTVATSSRSDACRPGQLQGTTQRPMERNQEPGNEPVRRLSCCRRRRGDSSGVQGVSSLNGTGDVTLPRGAAPDGSWRNVRRRHQKPEQQERSGCARDPPPAPAPAPQGSTRWDAASAPHPRPSARDELLKPDASEPNSLIKNGQRTRTDLQPPPPSRVSPPPTAQQGHPPTALQGPPHRPGGAPQPHRPAGSPRPPPPSRAPQAPPPSRVTPPPSRGPPTAQQGPPSSTAQQGPPHHRLREPRGCAAAGLYGPDPQHHQLLLRSPLGTPSRRHTCTSGVTAQLPRRGSTDGSTDEESVVDTCRPRRWVTQPHQGRGPALGQVGGPWGHPAEGEKSEVV
eukprot:XP_013972925.1 proline-rich protein HaeIII subfamily 1-like [Canis lupus familiaris]